MTVMNFITEVSDHVSSFIFATRIWDSTLSLPFGRRTESHGLHFVSSPHPGFSSLLTALFFSLAHPHVLTSSLSCCVRVAHSGWQTLTGFPQHDSANLASGQPGSVSASLTLIYSCAWLGMQSLRLSSLSQLPPTRLLGSNNNNNSHLGEFFEGYLEGRFQKRFHLLMPGL